MSVEKAVKKLGSSSIASRRSAAEQLGQLGLSSPSAIPKIVPALAKACRDSDEGVARRAGFSIYSLCQKQPQMMAGQVNHMVAALNYAISQGGNPPFDSYNPFTSINNGFGFVGGKYPQQCAPAVTTIAKCLNFPIYHPENPKWGLDQLYASALRALGIIGAANPAAVSNSVFFMVRCMGDSYKYKFFKAQNPNDPNSLRYTATRAVEAVGNSSPATVIPHLVTTLNDTETVVSDYAHKLLNRLFANKSHEKTIPATLKCTTHEKPQVQEKARDLIIEWGKSSPKVVVQYLIGSFQNPDKAIRVHAAYALGEIGKHDPNNVAKDLTSMVYYMRNDPDKEVRQSLADAVFKVGEMAPQLLRDHTKEFKDALGDDYHHVRWRVAQIIGLLGAREPLLVRDSIPILLEMHRDPHEHVRWRAEDAVKACGVDKSQYLLAAKSLEQVQVLLEENMKKNIGSMEEADLLGRARAAFDSMDYEVSLELVEKSKEMIVEKMDEHMAAKKASMGVAMAVPNGQQLPTPSELPEPEPAPDDIPEMELLPIDEDEASGSKFCPYCGKENDPEFNFCIGCKKKLPDQ